MRHTSSETEGQIYVPEINALLMIACIVLVLVFKTSSALAAAYGVAVTLTGVGFWMLTCARTASARTTEKR